jgi:hypothetical protein
VQEVIPEAVQVINEETGQLGLKTDFIIPYLVGAIQEQQAKINAVNAKTINNWIKDGVLSIEVPADFHNTATFRQQAFFYGIAEFLDTVIFRNKVEFANQVTFDRDSAGVIRFEAGQTIAEVTFSKPYSLIPVISLTANQISDAKYAVVSRSETGFRVEIAPASDQVLEFSWTAVAAKDSGITGGQVATPSANITVEEPTATPEPSPISEPSSSEEATSTAELSSGSEPTPTPTPEPAMTGHTLSISPNEFGFVRLRENSMIESVELAQIPVGTTLEYFDEEYGWYQVSYDGQIGWISGLYVSLD